MKKKTEHRFRGEIREGKCNLGGVKPPTNRPRPIAPPHGQGVSKKEE